MHLKKTFQEISYYRNAYFLALSATTGCICFGWDIALIGGILALPSFQQYFELHKSSAARAAFNGNIISVLQAGGCFGALISTWLAGRYGRRLSMLVSAVIYLIGSVIQSTAGLGSTPAVGLKVLFFGRFFGGVGVGLMIALASTYVSECAPRRIRGRCTGTIEVTVGLGNMLAFWVNYGVAVLVPGRQIQWRLPFIVQIIPGVLFFVLMLFQPESPRWLVERERYEDAAKSLAYIVRTDPSSPAVQATLSEIRADFIGRHKLSLWSQYRLMGESKIIAYRCLIPSILICFQQWSGTNAINYYAPVIFASLGFPTLSASLFATGIYGAVKFITSCLALALVIESWGRKRTLFFGGLAQGLMMIWIAGYTATHREHTAVVPATYFAIIAMYLYGVFFCVGWGLSPLVLGSEIAPGPLRQAAMSLAGATTWLFAYVIAQLMPWMLDRIGWGTYLVFGLTSVTMAVFVWIGVPETTGVPLEDVGRLFEGGEHGCSMWVQFVQDAPGGRWLLSRANMEISMDTSVKKRVEGEIVPVDDPLII